MNETCEVCIEDCGKCNAPPLIQGTIVEQFVQDATPSQVQITGILKQVGLEQLLQTALELMPNFEIMRTITILQLADASYQSLVTITVKNKTNNNLSGLALLEIVPKSLAQNSSEIISNNETIILQEDPVLEFVMTGRLEKDTNFYYSVNKKIENNNIFGPAIVLNQATKTMATCETGCNDKNPCTKDQCINENCVFFLVADNTPCGYAQKCRKGMCIAYPTTAYQEPIRIFGQPIEIIIIAALIIMVCAGMAVYFYKMRRNKAPYE